MCGIVGYVGDRSIKSVLLVGLERLSYRGYDSSGIAIMSDNELGSWKRSGKIHELDKAMENLTITGQLGIGHTRWATHGEPTEINAHPHFSPNGKIAIVHNGIIENYQSIKNSLVQEGHIFRSDTDTETVVHLVERYIEDGLEVAVRKALGEIEGSFAIAAIAETEPDKIVVCRKGSPIIIGIGENENFVSSDINSIISHTKDMIYLEDHEIAIVTKDSVCVKDPKGHAIKKEVTHIKWDPISAEKSGYDHFMLKEIFEQPAVIRQIISKLVSADKCAIALKHVRISDDKLRSVKRFIIQACGTSWHAGLVAKYLIEKYNRVLTDVDISSEFRYRHKVEEGNEVVIALSQSGETADTLACLREAKSKFFSVLAFVNAKNSSMDRESDGVVYSYAGQEVGVASTKNYIAQLATIYLFTVFLGKLRGTLSADDTRKMINDLTRLPEYIESILGQSKTIEAIADKYYESRDFIFIGRGVNYPSALEGALKLKEISYIHATGYPAGELKHGPIALLDENMPVVCICPKSDTYDKMVSNIQEVKARKAKTIVIATEGDTEIQKFADDIIYIPSVPEDLSPILTAIPLQLMAYYIALKLECDVDQPRNLAKSVTVE